ncbi:hypothetical protein D3C75_688620 [compost metagenome]
MLIDVGEIHAAPRQGDLSADIQRIGAPQPPFEILNLKRQRQRCACRPLAGTGQQTAVIGNHGIVRALRDEELLRGAIHLALAGAGHGWVHITICEEAGLVRLTVRYPEPQSQERQRLFRCGQDRGQLTQPHKPALAGSLAGTFGPAGCQRRQPVGAIHPVLVIGSRQNERTLGKGIPVILRDPPLLVARHHNRVHAKRLTHIAEATAGRGDNATHQIEVPRYKAP